MRKPSASMGVPPRTGGYDYSTDRSQNVRFNQGEPVGDSGVPSTTGGYDYSAKGRGTRINSHHAMLGGYASVQKPGQVRKDSTDARKAARNARLQHGLKHS